MKIKIVIFVIGVSGVGKSTIGKLLSKKLSIPFFDGDDYHSANNIEKMSSGIALNDNDRLDWLRRLNELAHQELENNGCIIACSALKKSYRSRLLEGIADKVKLVFLYGSFGLIEKRIRKRENHFMTSELLFSQFETLETPSSKEESVIKVNVDKQPSEIVEYLQKKLFPSTEFGLLGLGVMGKSLSRNLARNGFKLSVYNRHIKGTEEDVAINFVQEFEEMSKTLPFDDIQDFVESLQTPRKIMLMVNAGNTVDLVINQLLPYLSDGDILIDGGNSNFKDTQRRFQALKEKNIHFIGCGVSGGEAGALNGPSIMPSGEAKAYKKVRRYLKTIAAKGKNNKPCCTFIGKEGSGHFVKMVHNGIEYAEMQLLSEVFSIFSVMGKAPNEIADILESWTKKANSYLLKITIDILRKKEGQNFLVNKILDKAGNKGTGNWATISSAQLGIPSTMLVSALFARYISYFKEERLTASGLFKKETVLKPNFSNEELLDAYQFARIINHYQGFRLIAKASADYDWAINLSNLAQIWTEGCIIKSDLMLDLVEVFKETDNILTHHSIVKQLKWLKFSSKKVVVECILNDIAVPCLNEAVSFLNAYSTAHSSANIIQAQRDYFGAHTYQRKDDKSHKFYHTIWE